MIGMHSIDRWPVEVLGGIGAVAARARRSKPAGARRRVAGAVDEPLRLFARLDKGADDSGRAEVQILTDQIWIEPQRPRQYHGAAGNSGLQHPLHVVEAMGRMLCVDDDQVEPGSAR